MNRKKICETTPLYLLTGRHISCNENSILTYLGHYSTANSLIIHKTKLDDVNVYKYLQNSHYDPPTSTKAAPEVLCTLFTT